MARLGPCVSVTLTKAPKGTIWPLSLRVFSRVMSSGRSRNWRVGLGDDLVSAAEAVEIVDVKRAEINLHRLEEILQRHALLAWP